MTRRDHPLPESSEQGAGGTDRNGSDALRVLRQVPRQQEPFETRS